MSKTHLAQLVATAMQANCGAHLAGRKSRADWSAEQKRLWKLAGDKRVASAVLKLVTR